MQNLEDADTHKMTSTQASQVEDWPIFKDDDIEHIMESQDQAEVDQIKANLEQCRMTLQDLGYAEFTFEDFITSYVEFRLTTRPHQVEINAAACLVVMFFRFVTSGEIQKRSEFFEPFIQGLTSASTQQFCKSAVEPMGEESYHVHITTLSDARGVPIRVLYLDRSSCDNGTVNVNHHDFLPVDRPSANNGGAEAVNPFITLLYLTGHYDILHWLGGMLLGLKLNMPFTCSFQE
ncbi:hypothetical protein ACH5RR_030907 [Cinchona calisaya]|uniref:Ubiquitinyl hydrolase 1 n=1 Tax=Cinchona calisaya TaxID=153742 RepID=A0ABD2YW13_9GENT